MTLWSDIPIELVRDILLQVNLPGLDSMYLVEHRVKMLLDTEDFWAIRIGRDFPSFRLEETNGLYGLYCDLTEMYHQMAELFFVQPGEGSKGQNLHVQPVIVDLVNHVPLRLNIITIYDVKQATGSYVAEPIPTITLAYDYSQQFTTSRYDESYRRGNEEVQVCSSASQLLETTSDLVAKGYIVVDRTPTMWEFDRVHGFPDLSEFASALANSGLATIVKEVTEWE